jgi:hypothetical protein
VSVAIRTVSALTLLMGAALFHHGHIVMFLASVKDLAAQKLPPRRFHWNVRPSLIQLYRRDPAVHYEVWVQRKARAIEVGLHFEGSREENGLWASLLAERAVALRRELGGTIELEEWSRSWFRLHETIPVRGEAWRPKEQLTPALARTVAGRFFRYVDVLDPILAKAGLRR